MLNIRHLLYMFVRSAAQGKHNLTPRVEPEIIETRDGQKKHDKDEAVVNDDMFYVAHIVNNSDNCHETYPKRNPSPICQEML